LVVFWGEKIQLLNWKYVFLPKRIHKLQKVSLFNYALNFWAILFPPFKWIVWLIIKWAFCAHFRNFKVQTNDWKLLDMIAIRERTKRKKKNFEFAFVHILAHFEFCTILTVWPSSSGPFVLLGKRTDTNTLSQKLEQKKTISKMFYFAFKTTV